ncbi:uncharacterized protein LOC131429138 [Malaya genurostris]|uniref:uncharacterized protein LOC131429138 n=1 Tax=Malaya genurostris TaxID=325434 RepID=UPI0026F3EFB1|nr:uncharacterized protein LOC131429138 [Malaya genurostris]
MLHQNVTLRSSDTSNTKSPSTPSPNQNPLSRTGPIVQPRPSPPHQPSTLEEQVATTSTAQTVHVSTTLLGNVRTIPSTVLLQTAVVKVIDTHGYALWARALLDPASQLNLITEDFSQKLKLRRIKTYQEIGGVGNSTTISSYAVIARLQSHCSGFTADYSFHVLPGITRELPAKPLNTQEWSIPSNIVLADPTFNDPGPIDMILGMEMYYDLIEEGIIRLGPNLPTLQKTVLGWVVSGKIGNTPTSSFRVAHICDASVLESQLTRFWELESCQTTSTLSIEETRCEEYFAATTIRNTTGRFEVHLPKRTPVISTLGKSKEIAVRRFLALERRLSANPSLRESYTNFIEEYRQLGHMIETPDPFYWPSYFLPHHCVIKPDSLTTKLRVVFDASCATDTGVSLNDALMVGPVVQDDMISVVLRFRMSRYAIIADIEKIYRQVVVHSSDQPLQQIIWRNSPQEPLRTFQLTTVTYGTSCAPYLATKCLQELAKLGRDTHPRAAEAVHVELVGDLSSDSFIAALKRFVARRGKPKLIECDNATNFKGASRELEELSKQFNSQQMQYAVSRSCAEDGIEFKFIPPRSPNFGGLWEAAVKSLKSHLRATLGNSTLTVDQLTTLLTQIEACLNSRPLTQTSTDPEDLDFLTPGHFLIHRPLTTIVEPSLENVPLNRLDRWQVVQEFLRRIWKRWSTEYLSGLQPRTKWTRQMDNIAIGTMVLVKEDNLPPLKWRIGRVVHIFKADDGNIRVVMVKTQDGEYRRAISKICVLPIRESSLPTADDTQMTNHE